MSLDSRVRWVARHGLARTVLRRSARNGHLDAQLMTQQELQNDPYPYYEQIRAKGPLYSGPISKVTTDHALCMSVLRSDAFGVGVDRDRLPRVARTALRVATPREDGQSHRPAVAAGNRPAGPHPAATAGHQGLHGPRY